MDFNVVDATYASEKSICNVFLSLVLERACEHSCFIESFSETGNYQIVSLFSMYCTLAELHQIWNAQVWRVLHWHQQFDVVFYFFRSSGFLQLGLTAVFLHFSCKACSTALASFQYEKHLKSGYMRVHELHKVWFQYHCYVIASCSFELCIWTLSYLCFKL